MNQNFEMFNECKNLCRIRLCQGEDRNFQKNESHQSQCDLKGDRLVAERVDEEGGRLLFLSSAKLFLHI